MSTNGRCRRTGVSDWRRRVPVRDFFTAAPFWGLQPQVFPTGRIARPAGSRRFKLATHSASKDREPLSGLVERITFHSPDTGFCVLRVKVRGHRELVTVLGAAASIQPGEFIQASGRWDNHREHGMQFRTTFLKVMPPSSLDGIEKYLGSGMIRGIGPHFAKKLVEAFGEEVFDVIETAPERLSTLDGIGPKRVERITSGWADQQAIREIMVFLQSHGVGTSRVVRIYKTYGADAIPLVSENPYRLARDIKGIGFLTADQIAARLGIEKTAMIRARAGIAYTLAEAVSEGHCGLPVDDLLPMAEKLLEIPADILRDALQQELQDETVVADTIGERRCMFLGHLWNAEKVIAERLQALATGPPFWPGIETDKAIPWVERKLGVTLAASQREAVKRAVASKVMVITGGPGVGKTTLVNAILRILVNTKPTASGRVTRRASSDPACCGGKRSRFSFRGRPFRARKENLSMHDWQSLAHVRWECKYHVVIIPKFRRKILYGQLRKQVGRILRALCDQRGVELLEGKAMADHVHLCLSIPPKYSVAHTVGFLKGKSAVQIHRKLLRERRMTGLHFWSTGYCVSTVGLDEGRIREYIREQEQLEAGQGDLDLK